MAAASKVYEKLRQQLDQYSVGFPASESGKEMAILKKMFTEEEAEMFLLLSLSLETPEDVARRNGRQVEATAALLDRMAEKGQIFRLRRGGTVKYGAAPFVVGSFEYQLGTLDRELAQLTDEYMEETLFKTILGAGASSMLRPIPINRSVPVSYQVATYEDSRHILRQQKLIAVAECICRKMKGLLEEACHKPREVCMVFGAHAEYYLDRNMARKVTVEEAEKIMEQAEAAGLVTQPFNTVNPGGMCNCCGDCCGILRALNKQPKPADMVVSNYFAVVDAAECTGCETCLERCQMKAIAINDEGVAVIDLDRCIGCGLCVSTCPSEAMGLELKAEEKRRTPPASNMEQMLDMAKARGTSLMPLFADK
jgi:Pyruvate/2-oxoacid:ferredoxin oxidoreductase delta subunit